MTDNTPLTVEEDIFVFPASFAQKRLWFLDQWEPGSYNIPTAVRLTGKMVVEAMENGLKEIVRRHEVLRTTFEFVDGNLMQVVVPHIQFSMPLIDLQGFSPEIQKAKMRRLVREDTQNPFDLSHGPLLRASMLKLSQEHHVLLVTMHHIVSDAWSMGIFFSELAALYTSNVLEQPSTLVELPIQYVDYALWQNSWLQGEVLDNQLNYWKKQLSDLPLLQLPTDHPRPAIQSYRGANLLILLPKPLTDALKVLCRRERVTLFMILLATFQLLIYRYTNQDDIAVGIPIAGRTESNVEKLIGCFINTLVLRTDLSGNPTFRELLTRVRDVALSGYAHQDLPFEKLVEELQPERDLSRNTLTQVMFALQNVPQGHLSLPNLSLSPLKLDSETAMLGGGNVQALFNKQQNMMYDNEPAMFDLDLMMWERGDEILGEFKYNTDLFDAATIKRMQHHFMTILESVTSDPNQHIADLFLLSQDEQYQILIEWNATQTELQQQGHFHQVFEAQVEKNSHSIAVRCQEHYLTYRELNAHANKLAHLLRERGVQAEVTVAVLLERGIDMLTSILAIFKAGGVYLPLDAHHPATRLKHVLQHSNAQFVLTTEHTRPVLSPVLTEQSDSPQVIMLDSESLNDYAQENLPSHTMDKHLAYIIYTSGSTGVPKGVMVEQKGMLNHLYAKIADLQLQPEDSVAQTASQCFDISVWQFLAALLVGGCVEILPDEVAHDPANLVQAVALQHITILETVPSLLRALLDIQEETHQQPINTLRWLIPTGEALPVDLCQRWLTLYPQVPLLNAYGPTECSDDVTHHRISEIPDSITSSIPIGQAVQNTTLYVLDRTLMPVPIGVNGELYVGGTGVGRGYMTDARRTAESFLPDPFSLEDGARLYKTGDLARFLPDGTLEFLGRIDQQVKLRGYRIELGEIEAVLRQQDAIRDAIVLMRQDSGNEQRLVAYIVTHDNTSIAIDRLQSVLKEKIPEYMVPSAFVQLPALPHTANGKIDHRALPVPQVIHAASHSKVEAPRDALEEKLMSIWHELLHVESISIHDDFFDLGGHSLLSVRLVSQIRQQFGQHMPLSAIFQARTIAALADMLRQHTQNSPWSSEMEQSQPHLDLQAEIAQLQAISPEVWPTDVNIAPNNILLTGATGFLGAFLLADLLEQTNANVHCLVRCSSTKEGAHKLQFALEESLLWKPQYVSRIIPVPGNLEHQRLGLSVQAFEQLAQCIDVIYHNGAMVNAIYPYQALKAANVLGTGEILRLATQNKIKPLHYISTLSVFSQKKATPDRAIREQDALDDHRDFLQGGYAQSKWAAEKLVTIARSRGLPVVIYRPGRITGHSKSGAWKTNDVLCRLLKGCIQLGVCPGKGTGESIEMTPVDYVSRAIVSLSRRKASFGQAFHLFNPHTISISDLVTSVSEFGYQLYEISNEQWLEEAQQAQDDSLADLAHLFPAQKSGEKSREPRYATFDNHTSLVALTSSGITCPPADAQLVQTYLTYFVQSGFLRQPEKTALVQV